MVQTFSSYEKYVSDFRAFAHDPHVNGPAWLHDIRKQGLESFKGLGFPTATRGNERWKYSNVTPIAKATFEYPIEGSANGVSLQSIKTVAPWDESWARLVFVDGVFSSRLSTDKDRAEGLQLANLKDAVMENGALVQEHLGRLATVDGDGFTAINTAFLRDGAVVYVPENSASEAVLHLVFLTCERPKPTVTHPRTLIIACKQSRLTVIESYVSLSDAPYFTNTVAEIIADDGAQIEHYRYLGESPRAFHIGTTRVRLGQDSTFTSTSFATGTRLARNDLNVLLDAPGGACYLNGLYATARKGHIDNHIDVDHAKPHTTSDQYFKGILSDRSRAVFSGRVLVRILKKISKQIPERIVITTT